MSAHPGHAYVLHENGRWLSPFAAALEERGIELREWPLDQGAFGLDVAPPDGVYWSRLSASASTREHPHAKDAARATLRWIEAHGRPVVNGTRVIEFEVSKAAQYVALRSWGISVPRTSVVVGGADLLATAAQYSGPFVVKVNEGGTGAGVVRFDDVDAVAAAIESGVVPRSNDGVLLVQEFVRTAAPFVTRLEFVGGRLVYAVRVDTLAGDFELCPADADDGSAEGIFSLRTDIHPDDRFSADLGAFLLAHDIQVAGVEFFETADGRRIVYDVNTNTNYNPYIESITGRAGASAVADLLADKLAGRR